MNISKEGLQPAQQNGKQSSVVEILAELYPYTEKTGQPTSNLIKNAKKILPKEMIQFWEKYGFGVCQNGILQVVNPLDYMTPFYQWLGGVNYSRFPLFMTAFGNIIYYRKLSPTESGISILDIHYRKIEVLSYSFEDCLKDTQIMDALLDKSLYEQAVIEKGPLKANEIFCFVPALVLGGTKDVAHVDKAIAPIHQEILFAIGS